jgi:adenosylcobinamide-phosphate synthase
MFDSPSVIILIAAFILDSLLGDPRYPLHPIRIIGWIADLLRKTLFDLKLNGFFSGFILTTLMILLPLNVYILLRLALESFHPLAPLVLDVFILYSCIALRDMVRHAKPIA